MIANQYTMAIVYPAQMPIVYLAQMTANQYTMAIVYLAQMTAN